MSDKPKALKWNWSTTPDHDAIAASNEHEAIHRVGGLRDYFAAAALRGLLDGVANPDHAPIFARDAYAFADAMLAARKAKP